MSTSDDDVGVLLVDWRMLHRESLDPNMSKEVALAALESIEAWCRYARAAVKQEHEHASVVKQKLARAVGALNNLNVDDPTELRDEIIEWARSWAGSVGADPQPFEPHEELYGDLAVVIEHARRVAPGFVPRLQKNRKLVREAMASFRAGHSAAGVERMERALRTSTAASGDLWRKLKRRRKARDERVK